ncbi:hypothetical protein V5K00_RS10365 [Enterobacter asburiae]
MSESVFVSFYTDNWIYPQLAERLVAQLEAMGLKHDIRRMKQGTDWLANTRIKARFIRQMLDIYPSVVWLDVDSDVHQLPRMLMAFGEDLLLRPHSTVPGRTWHVSVMGWKSTRQTKALCNAWIKQADAAGGTDEAAFDAVIGQFSGKVSIGRMPLKYHRLPHEPDKHAVITIGISQDEDKMRIKYGEGFK